MIGRMSSAQMHQGSLNVIFDAQARLQKTQEALATGKKINDASDDPVASAQITAVRAELSRLEVMQKNVNTAYDELAITETSLSSAEDLISRAREIAVQGANSVLGPEDRAILECKVSDDEADNTGQGQSRDHVVVDGPEEGPQTSVNRDITGAAVTDWIIVEVVRHRVLRKNSVEGIRT